METPRVTRNRRRSNKDKINGAIVYDRDFEYDYFGFKTLERSYLMRCDGDIAERPQHMIMRVAIGIHGSDVDAAIETYELMSQKYFTHATPTLFNAGTPRPQLSSCFLLAMKEDSIEGIYDTLKRFADSASVFLEFPKLNFASMASYVTVAPSS